MKLLSTNGFIVYAKKMNEADMLLSYITEDYGKITCFANNARKSKKRFLGKLEPAMLTNIKFYEKPGMTLDILYEADIVEDYKNGTGGDAQPFKLETVYNCPENTVSHISAV